MTSLQREASSDRFIIKTNEKSGNDGYRDGCFMLGSGMGCAAIIIAVALAALMLMQSEFLVRLVETIFEG